VGVINRNTLYNSNKATYECSVSSLLLSPVVGPAHHHRVVLHTTETCSLNSIHNNQTSFSHWRWKILFINPWIGIHKWTTSKIQPVLACPKTHLTFMKIRSIVITSIC